MKFLKNLTRIAVIIAIYAIFMLVSLRQCKAQVLDSSFYQWQIYEIQENELDYKKCYIVANPVESDSNHNARKKPYIMIARYQKDRVEEISLYSGFEFKKNSELLMLVDKEQFNLITKGDIAWARSKNEDIFIIENLLHGAVMKVRSNSSLGTYAVDQYSLKGITKAYARMRKICN